ncbi:MAG: hypothetical protein H6925_02510 [Holosporaceae bacterium]|nr:MAG: hypothetical protein H6925_02510 [Holosporaceae bacterium]
MGADAPLDIAFMVYEKIFPETFGPYKHKFDVVVLEWVTKSTMVHPCTLYNALQMLKSGGTIVIDLHKSYNLRAYGRGMPLEELAGPDAQLLDPSSEEKPHKYLVAWLFSLGVENIVVQQGKESPYCPERAKVLQEESAIITGLVSEIVHTNIQNNIEPYKKFFQTVQIDAKTPEQVFNLMNTPLNDDKHRALKRRLEKAKMTF